MFRVLLAVAGVLNLLFCAFHVSMFWGIATLQGVTEQIRIGIYTSNVAVVLATAFLGYAFLAHRKDVMTTGLGAAALAFAALFYLSRAARDLVFMTSDYSIAAICAVVGFLHIVLLFGVRLRAAN